MNLLFQSAWASSPGRLAIVLAVTIGFAALARALRGVTTSGMLAGAMACFLMFASAGPAAFATLTALFLLTLVTTRLGYRRKQELGLAEQGDGRNAWQVLANLAAAAASAVVFSFSGNRVWLLGLTAALAEAATDTVASEIGQSSSRTAFLITTWERVPAGTDGGITLVGTAAGAAAGLAVAAGAALGNLIPSTRFWIPVAAGIAGMLADSVLGAILQRKGWMTNETVNVFGTLAAAGVAAVLNT